MTMRTVLMVIMIICLQLTRPCLTGFLLLCVSGSNPHTT